MQLLVTIALLAAPTRASALLESAALAYQRLEFDRALELTRQAGEAGDATAAETLALNTLMAKAASVLGYAEVAQRAFARVLELEPAFELAGDESPKLLAQLAAARRVAGPGLKIEVSSRQGADGLVQTRVTVTHDTQQLVRAGRLVPDAGPALELPRVGDGLAASWPCAAVPCPHHVTLLDAAGNAVKSAGSPAAPLVADAPPLAERPWWARARSLWFLAAVGFAAVGGYFAYAFQRDERTLVSIDANRGAYRWAEELAADRGRKIDYGMLWGMFAASAGCGALVAVTW